MTDETPRCEPPPELRDRDGWHWVQCIRGPNPDSYEPELVYWYSVERRAFCGASGWDDSDIGEGYRYIAPVTPPEVVRALVEALEGVLPDAECADDSSAEHVARLEAALAALHAAAPTKRRPR